MQYIVFRITASDFWKPGVVVREGLLATAVSVHWIGIWVRTLPKTTTVRLLITVGLPAALDQLQEQTHLAGSGAPFPADRVDGWLNLVNSGDSVCLGVGLRPRFSMVTDHRILPRWSHDWAEFHGARTYLADLIVGQALHLALYRGQAPIPYVAQESFRNDALLPSYISVAFAGGIAESASEAKHRIRGRKILNGKLLHALSEAEGREVSWTDVELHVGVWVASGPSLRVGAGFGGG